MVARRIIGTGGGGKISPEVEDTAGGSYCLISLRMESNFVSAPFASNLFEDTFTASAEESSCKNWEETSNSWKSEGGRGVTRPRGFDPRIFGVESDNFDGGGLGITRRLGLSFRILGDKSDNFDDGVFGITRPLGLSFRMLGDRSEDFLLGMSFDDFLEFLLIFIFKLDFLL